MITHLLHVSWLGVLLGSLSFSALGALWFVALFAKPYAAALGRTDLADTKPGPLFVIGPLLCGLVVTITNALLMRALGVSGARAALEFGLVSGVGYLAPMTVNIAINPNFPRPLAYGALNAPYFVLGNIVSCTIVALMS